MADKVIDNLVDEGSWKVFLGTSMVEVAKVCANVNSALFFVNMNEVGCP
jgi:hypothetical protein